MSSLIKQVKPTEKSKSAAAAKQLLLSSQYLLNNKGNGVVILGDSISHGAYAGNAYTNHYAYLLARAISAETGNKKALGEFPMEAIHPGDGQTNLITSQFVDVEFLGNWGALHPVMPVPYKYPLGNFGEAAKDAVNGKTYSTNDAIAKIKLTFPTFGEVLTIRYKEMPNGGSFTIKVNGVLKQTISTNKALVKYNVESAAVLIEDNGTGECVVLIEKIDASTVEFNSLVAIKSGSVNVTDYSNRLMVHNWSQTGRELRFMSEAAIIEATNSVCLIMSLGHNDWMSGADTDDVIFSQFKQRIDWLIKYINVFKNLCVVQDFVWYASVKNSRVRQQLKRLADATSGIYINYPDQFFNDASQPVQSPPQLNTPMFLWADASHPNKAGNELIFSTLATSLGLTVNTKEIALSNYDFQFPLKIKSGCGFENSYKTLVGAASSVQRVGGAYLIKLNIKYISADFMPSFSLINVLDSLPEKFTGGKEVVFQDLQLPIKTHYGTGKVELFAIVESPTKVNVWSNENGLITDIKVSFLVSSKT